LTQSYSRYRWVLFWWIVTDFKKMIANPCNECYTHQLSQVIHFQLPNTLILNKMQDCIDWCFEFQARVLVVLQALIIIILLLLSVLPPILVMSCSEHWCTIMIIHRKCSNFCWDFKGFHQCHWILIGWWYEWKGRNLRDFYLWYTLVTWR